MLQCPLIFILICRLISIDVKLISATYFYISKALEVHVLLLPKFLERSIIRENTKKHKLTNLQKSIVDDIINATDGFDPGMKTRSIKWRNWLAELDIYTCIECRKLHGKVLEEDEFIPIEPPLHDRCRCRIELLHAVFPGFATRNGLEGADYWLKYFGHLPQADGRVWYEADINYTNGYRNRHRILFSNDGLIFVTYDHYETFWEVI